jgi:hypothetical protein
VKLSESALVIPDIEPILSTVDGTVLNSRTHLREHNRKHNVTFTADFTEHWQMAAEKRAAYYRGEHNSGNQREILAREFEKRS